MPMYRGFVPEWVRPWIYIVLAFCFQFSGGIYLGAMSHIMGEQCVMREDLLMCQYSTLAGMALYFVLLFRMKFRFTNQSLLITAASVIFVCNLLTMHELPLPLRWTLCFIAGAAKIQGTFECMSNIQLWMTPKRDFAVFFPLLHMILLSSIVGSGWLASTFAHYTHWSMMHYFVCGLMLFVIFIQLVLTRPHHAMPQIVPLKGIDWWGGALWAIFFLQIAFIFTYGDWLDWWNSPAVRFLCGTSLINLAICLHRMLLKKMSFYELKTFTYRYAVPIILLTGLAEALFSTEHVLEMVFYEEVMHYSEHTFESIKLWAIPGCWAGCLFSLGWLKLMRWNAYKLIAVGLLFFCAYAASMYFLIAGHVSPDLLIAPQVLRGIAYALLSITLMWCLHEVMSFEHFFQALSIFNILHMFIGGSFGAALHSYGLRYYMADGFARYGLHLDAVNITSSGIGLGASGMGDAVLKMNGGSFGMGSGHPPMHFAEVMNGMVGNLLAQSTKILFGWALWIALFFAILMLLWDIPTVRRHVKRIPLWPTIGLGELRRLRNWEKRRRRKLLRREAAKA